MKTNKFNAMSADSDAQRRAMTSPIRLEILGLFMGTGPLSISDMAQRMGRPAGSLYHHVGLLEKAGILRKAGTRPKGKRYETLYEPVAERFALPAGEGDVDADAQAVKAMRSAFRMTLRDLEAALAEGRTVDEGPERNLFAMRMHICASPRLLGKLNDHLDAISDLLREEAGIKSEPAPGDKYISLTLALLPLRGRNTE